MPLPASTRVGQYEVLGTLGAGGMGEVYRARDTRLQRDVALKILPEIVADDPERLARFEREAQTLAALNHPNIAAIYGIEESASGRAGQPATRALVMELVEGDDLAQRLAHGALPLDEVLPIARQIADALDAAHEAGIIHRDLKPANIKVRPDGTAKVLDFGLAKALDPTASGAASASNTLANSPTVASPAMTAMGMILGTAAYMSPEQARGARVDKRADIWAFGVVLFEMLAGRRLFVGDTVSDTLAEVLKSAIDWTALPSNTPANVRRLLARCLERDPRRRLRDIADARAELDAGVAETPGLSTGRSVRSTILRMAPWALSAALATTLLTGSRVVRESSESQMVRRFAIDLPWHSMPNWSDFDVALSPRGTRLAYYGRHRNENDVEVYVRALDSLEGVALAGTREIRAMTFSPDGEWLAMIDRQALRKVSVHGGSVLQVAPIQNGGALGLSWGTDGAILVGDSAGLLRAPAAGGRVEPVTRVDAKAGETAHANPFHLPDGTHAFFTIVRGEDMQLAVADLARGTYQPLQLSGARAIYLSPGYIVFQHGTSLLAARFDVASMHVIGEAIPALENVWLGPYVASDGTMLYIPERGDSTARLVSVDRDGRPSPIQGERLDYSHLSLSPGGTQALLNIDTAGGAGADVYVRDIAQGTRRLLSSGNEWYPIWSPDGRWATYSTEETAGSRIVRQPADGSAPPETLVASKDLIVPTSWNAQTGDLAFFDNGSGSDIWILPRGGTPRQLLAGPSNERSGRFSHDGRFMAYVSDETGTFQVYVTPYPGPGPKVAVSVDGGLEPIWSSDDREIFFRKGGRVLAARMTLTPTLSASRPVELFDGPYTLDLRGHQRWDVGPDGKFLMVENSDDFRAVLIQNWTTEVERLLAGSASAR